MKLVRRYFFITLGCLIFALGFSLFLSPQNIAPGGVSGLAVIISHFFPYFPNGLYILTMNIPLLIIGAVCFGFRFFIGTFWASVISSLFAAFIEYFVPFPLSNDIFCCALTGGLIMGCGLGIVFRENVTTGGTDIIVKLVQQKIPHIKSGNIFVIIDSFIVILSGITFRDIDTAIYSGVALIISMFAFNYVLYGGMKAKLLIIIDSDVSVLTKTMSEAAGVTLLDAIGAYSGKKKTVIICAVDKRKYPSIISIIKNISPESVVITTPAEGFSHGHSVA